MSSGRRPSLVSHVRTQLLEEIDDGRLVTGDKLPNEYELADRFQVSRQTVREAIQSLLISGHLLRLRGTGTFVTTAPSRHALDTNVSYTAMIRDAGLEPGETVLQVLRRPATAGEVNALELGLGSDDTVVEVERIRSGNGRPLIYSRDRIPAGLLGDVTHELLSDSLYAMLEVAGHRVVGATARLLPVLANLRLAELLQVAPSAPLLHIHQVDRDAADTAVMQSDEWHVADAFDVIVNRRAPLDPGR
jgi:GntR family transcriptional regulator